MYDVNGVKVKQSENTTLTFNYLDYPLGAPIQFNLKGSVKSDSGLSFITFYSLTGANASVGNQILDNIVGGTKIEMVGTLTMLENAIRVKYWLKVNGVKVKDTSFTLALPATPKPLKFYIGVRPKVTPTDLLTLPYWDYPTTLSIKLDKLIKPEFSVFILGDSMTVAVSPKLTQKGVSNYGMFQSGEFANHYLQNKDLIKPCGDYAIIAYGMNYVVPNSAKPTSLNNLDWNKQQFELNYAEMQKYFKVDKIWVQTLPPRVNNPAFEAFRVPFNAWLKATYTNVIDLAALVENDPTWDATKRLPNDTTHFNLAGQNEHANLIKNTLKGVKNGK